MATCRICAADGVGHWLDFGPQALTNRFPASAAEPDYEHPCRLGVCRACGTAQLESPVPVDELRPRYDWIVYNEPERHLDEVADVLAALPGVRTVGGVTYKDDSTLARLTARGVPTTWRADLSADLGVTHPNGGIESVQDALTPATAERLVARHGRPDLLLVRHVFEHAYDLPQLLQTAAAVVRTGGYVLFEVPDATKPFDRADYTTVWEEHLAYYTPPTLRAVFERAGWEVVYLRRHEYTQEDVLVVIARPGQGTGVVSTDGVAAEIARAERFIAGFPARRDAVRRFVAGYAARGPVALLGAGHLSGAFINLYGIADLVAFVADDNAHKQGRRMGGSGLPILPSSELAARGVSLCLMTVRAEIEAALAAKNAAVTARGGVLASIFPGSPIAFDKLSTAAEAA